MKKLYSGIGPRKTPLEAQALMTEIASQLASSQWTLRSGHGKRGDEAFEAGAPPPLKEVYLPEHGFNGAPSAIQGYEHYKVGLFSERVIHIAQDHHPYYDNCQQSTKNLFNRNVQIILGEEADFPSACVIYWHFSDNDIEELGGTNHSLRIARTFNIPTFNIGDAGQLAALVQFIKEYEA
jgi:hypothetical protein